MKKHFSILAAVFTILLASGCLTAQQPAQTTAAQKPATHPASRVSVYAPAERITNFDALKIQLRQYHDCTCTCGCYVKDLDHQANRAIAILRASAAHRRPNEKLALVLDIDETSLSNYEEMSKADFAYDSAIFHSWINAAKATAIPGTLRLFQEAQRLSVTVFFITGRTESEREATERNLREQGYQNWQQLFMRPPRRSPSRCRYSNPARAPRLPRRVIAWCSTSATNGVMTGENPRLSSS